MKTRKIAPTSKTAAPANENCGNKNKNRKGKKGKEWARSAVRYPLLRFDVCMVMRGICIHSFIHSFMCSSIYSLVNLFVYLQIYLLIILFTHSIIYSLISSYIHSTIHAFIRPFMHSRQDHLGICCNPGQYTPFLQQIEGYKKRNKDGVKIPKQQQGRSEEKGRVK